MKTKVVCKSIFLKGGEYMTEYEAPILRAGNTVAQCGCNPCNTASRCGCGACNDTPACGCSS